MNARTRPVSIIAVVGFLAALAAAAAGMLAGQAYRFHALPLGDAFAVLRWAAYGGAGACAVSVLGLLRAHPGAPRRGFAPALLGAVLGAAVFWLPFSQQHLARSVPPIHDITTDTVNPPEFRAVVPLRPRNANSLSYGGEALARRQRQAYPDIRPLRIEAAPAAVFDAAVAVAREMGWTIVDVSRGVDASGGPARIEAVATTFWFGFKDDVVVRVAGSPGGARVDVRSVSRVGVSDIGKNAERVRAFLADLEARIRVSGPT